MSYSRSEIHEMHNAHVAELRKSIPEPNEATLAIWNFEDQRAKFKQELFEEEEDSDSFPSFFVSSEVKIK